MDIVKIGNDAFSDGQTLRMNVIGDGHENLEAKRCLSVSQRPPKPLPGDAKPVAFSTSAIGMPPQTGA